MSRLEKWTSRSIVLGRNDETVPFEQSEDLRKVMPNAEFHATENCGHIPHYEKPDEFNPILLKFLNTQKVQPS
jgi:pimeloyl-ACP methyl ester carboxylesterase